MWPIDGRWHEAEPIRRPRPYPLSVACRNLIQKLKSKILRPPKPPTGPNMPAPKHLFRSFYTLFTLFLHPFYTLFTF